MKALDSIYVKDVGAYELGLYRLPLKKKPSWLHRKMMNMLLGIKWIDLK